MMRPVMVGVPMRRRRGPGLLVFLVALGFLAFLVWKVMG